MVRNRKEVPNKEETKGSVRQQCSGIVCPNCGSPTRVSNGKPIKAENKHGRYRKCEKCGASFYTVETIEHIINLPPREK